MEKRFMDLLKTKINLEKYNIKFYFMCADCESKGKALEKIKSIFCKILMLYNVYSIL